MQSPASLALELPCPAQLQALAAERLAQARAGAGGLLIAEPALAALLRLASQATHASDALLLLQELQVQQLELEMQLDELRSAGC